MSNNEVDGLAVCDKCGREIPANETYWEAEGEVYCEDCLPEGLERIGERH